MAFEAFKAKYRVTIENYLTSAFDRCEDTEVCRIAKYISLNGGHRWRALVAAAAGTIFHENATRMVLPGAAGVELSHSASLILDDLPSMDDGQMRRGRPCAHRVFPMWAVELTPVFLVTMSYELALSNPLVNPDRRVAAAIVLSRSGVAMISGQENDVAPTSNQIDEAQLLHRYRQKSGALYAAAAEGGGILCGASDDCAKRLRAAGMWLGLAYQFLDDVADATVDPTIVGKDTQADANKLTSVRLFGVEGATSKSLEFQEQALDAIESYGKEADYLRKLITQASWAPS
ncbi:MAG: polyprenyl synthetase family protein [Pirellulaceae bacterium]|nr:polyprenyl synthetase family protein [Pirellulaceae bacterium]